MSRSQCDNIYAQASFSKQSWDLAMKIMDKFEEGGLKDQKLQKKTSDLETRIYAAVFSTNTSSATIISSNNYYYCCMSGRAIWGNIQLEGGNIGLAEGRLERRILLFSLCCQGSAIRDSSC